MFYSFILLNVSNSRESLQQCFRLIFCSVPFSPLRCFKFHLHLGSRSFHYKCIRSGRQCNILKLTCFVSDMEHIDTIFFHYVCTGSLSRNFSSLFYEFAFGSIPFVNYPHAVGIDFGRRSCYACFSVFTYSLRSGLFTVLIPKTIFTDSPFGTVLTVSTFDTGYCLSTTIAHGYSETIFNRRDIGYPFSFSYQFLQSCNSILVRVDLALQILDVIIIVFTRHKCSC